MLGDISYTKLPLKKKTKQRKQALHGHPLKRASETFTKISKKGYPEGFSEVIGLLFMGRSTADTIRPYHGKGSHITEWMWEFIPRNSAGDPRVL